MTPNDFRKLALTFPEVIESAHMRHPDFRVGGRIFATLASVDQGYGNLMLSLEQQAAFVEEMPELFLAVPGGWGRMGSTHIVLASADEATMRGALQTACNLRHAKSSTAKSKAKPKARKPR